MREPEARPSVTVGRITHSRLFKVRARLAPLSKVEQRDAKIAVHGRTPWRQVKAAFETPTGLRESTCLEVADALKEELFGLLELRLHQLMLRALPYALPYAQFENRARH